MEKYSNIGDLRSGWELIHLGNGEVPDSKIIATGADVLVVDAVSPISASVIAAMPQLKLIHSQGVAYNLIDCGGS